jgi:hypothetical protein
MANDPRKISDLATDGSLLIAANDDCPGIVGTPTGRNHSRDPALPDFKQSPCQFREEAGLVSHRFPAGWEALDVDGTRLSRDSSHFSATPQ